MIIDTESEEGIYAFIYCTKWRSGQVLPMRCDAMPDSMTTLKDSATQLLIKYKSGALVTQQDQVNNVNFVLIFIINLLINPGCQSWSGQVGQVGLVVQVF